LISSSALPLTTRSAPVCWAAVAPGQATTCSSERGALVAAITGRSASTVRASPRTATSAVVRRVVRRIEPPVSAALLVNRAANLPGRD
jgi:hypothetical protein